MSECLLLCSVTQEMRSQTMRKSNHGFSANAEIWRDSHLSLRMLQLES